MNNSCLHKRFLIRYPPPPHSQVLADTQLALLITRLGLPPLLSLVVDKRVTMSEEITGVCSVLLGDELGPLRLNLAALTIRAQIYGNCGHPTRIGT